MAIARTTGVRLRLVAQAIAGIATRERDPFDPTIDFRSRSLGSRNEQT